MYSVIYAAYIGETVKEMGIKPEELTLSWYTGAGPWTEKYVAGDREATQCQKACDIYGLTETSRSLTPSFQVQKHSHKYAHQ